MAKCCPKCGAKIENEDGVCSNCLEKVDNLDNNMKENVNASENNSKKVSSEGTDYPKLGLIFSAIGFLCCRLFSIVGLVFSVFALIKINNGEIDTSGANSNKKLMAILGIAIGAIGLLGFASVNIEKVISLVKNY